MKHLQAELAQPKQDFFGTHIPLMQHLGLQTVSSTEQEVITFLPWQAWNANSRADVHGGTLMAILDFTLSAAARGHDPLGVGLATIEMSTHFLDVARGELVFESQVLRRGLSTAFCEGNVMDSEGRRVCVARATFRLIKVQR